MTHETHTLVSLFVLLLAGITGVSAAAPDASTLAQATPGWQLVNSNGFGDPQTVEVSALEVFKGYLYAGTYHPVDPLLIFDGAQIFRSPDGVAWIPVTQPGFHDPHDSKPPAILDLAVFNGYLYASTGRGNAAQIWRSLDGVIWAPMVVAGFGDPDTVDITSLVAYNGWIYAGASNQNSGAQIWRSYSGSSNTWTKVAPVVPGLAGTRITAFAVFNGSLYAAVESAGLAQIWRSTDGAGWTTVMNNGFGGLATTTGGMAEFGGHLYVGAGNGANGAQLWRTNNGTAWEPAIAPGFGDPKNQSIEMVFVFQNNLHVSLKNVHTGMEHWRSIDGLHWEQANLDGFGDTNNSGSNWSNATAAFLGQLYVGTSNIVDGGEVWRMEQQRIYLPITFR